MKFSAAREVLSLYDLTVSKYCAGHLPGVFSFVEVTLQLSRIIHYDFKQYVLFY